MLNLPIVSVFEVRQKAWFWGKPQLVDARGGCMLANSGTIPQVVVSVAQQMAALGIEISWIWLDTLRVI
ncbi:hypothetical protein [Leisingera sp. F5]|uniref:hypothetical protein n=1 Tax=Leisingera sp. F5 TaxID=1813816 RepID=UPI0025BCBC0D|nr:hypothetical protein [Leisingera sp. F5]